MAVVMLLIFLFILILAGIICMLKIGFFVTDQKQHYHYFWEHFYQLPFRSRISYHLEENYVVK